MRTPRFLPGMSAHSRGFLLVLLAAFCYGLQPLFASFAYAGGANPIGLLLARFSIAAAVLLALLYRQRIGLPSLRLVRQNLLLGVGYGLAALGYYSASLPKLFSLLLALGGVALATGLSLAGASIGALWALFAAMAYGAAVIYGTHRVRHEHPLASAAIVLLGCAATFAVAALFQHAAFPVGGQAWLATLGLAVFATLIPVAAFLAGAPAIGPSAAATLSTVEPLVAVAIAVLLMGERLTLSMLVGGCMVLLAAVALARPSPAETPLAPVT